MTVTSWIFLVGFSGIFLSFSRNFFSSQWFSYDFPLKTFFLFQWNFKDLLVDFFKEFLFSFSRNFSLIISDCFISRIFWSIFMNFLYTCFNFLRFSFYYQGFSQNSLYFPTIFNEYVDFPNEEGFSFECKRTFCVYLPLNYKYFLMIVTGESVLRKSRQNRSVTDLWHVMTYVNFRQIGDVFRITTPSLQYFLRETSNQFKN